MYLVELRPGKEELYRTTEELAAAIRSGDVDVHSRIYHRATSKWISVTLHPQYKAIVAERTAPPPTLPPLERTNWTFFNDSADSLAGAHDDPEDDDKHGTDPNHPWRRPLALSITGGLLILGLQLAAAGPKPPWSSRQGPPSSARSLLPATMPASAMPASAMPAQTMPAPRVAAPAPRSGGVSSAAVVSTAFPAADFASPTISLVTAGASWTETNRGYMPSGGAAEGASPAPAAARAAPAVPRLPAAPQLRPKALLGAIAPPRPAPAAASGPTVLGFMQRWSAAHDSALTRLESGIRVARLDNLFATDRLSPSTGSSRRRSSASSRTPSRPRRRHTAGRRPTRGRGTPGPPGWRIRRCRRSRRR
jgi:hypothetical protein